MKRIEFLAPVESMRGSFSPKQKLLYALNNNPAFDAPVGRQYARNYQPTFIGAKRSASGLKYFACKTKSATLVTAESKLRMAITGAAGAIFADIQRNASTANSIYYRLQYAWKEYFKSPKTFRAWCMVYLEDMLSRKTSSTNMGRDAQGDIVYVHNPWYIMVRPQTAYVPEISNETLVKFWLQLGTNGTSAAPIYFTVDGQIGLAFNGLTFSNNDGLCDDTYSRINILNIDVIEGPEPNYVCVGNDTTYMKLGSSFVTADDVVVVNGKYTSTTEEPQP